MPKLKRSSRKAVDSKAHNLTIDLGQASVPAVNQYLQLAEKRNLPINSILLQLGLTPQLLADNSQKISGLKFQQLIAALIKLSQDELFGLHTAQFVQPGSYSVLGYISMNCETLGEAIEKIQPFEKLVGDMGTTSFEQCGHNLKMSWRCRFPNQLVRRHMIDNCLASWITFARYLSDRKSSPTEIWLSRETPNHRQQQTYQKLFGCPVLYHQASDSILFDQTLLSFPLNKGNKQLLSTLESHAKELIENLAHSQDCVSQTMLLIKLNLESQQFHQQDVARMMGVSAKTLQRRLKVENTNFQSVLDQARLDIAQDQLKNSILNLTQIGINLGFNEPRSFYRWFQKITGVTPGVFRKKIRL